MNYRGGGAPEKSSLRGKKAGFTLAEVLITLGILGVVIAMTLPTVVGKYKKQATISQLKKAYTVLSQMVLRAQEDNGGAYFSTSDTVNADATKKFFEQYWLPYFNNPTVSKEGKLPYGIGFAYKYMNGSQMGTNITTAYSVGRVFFTTLDGTAYFVFMMWWEKKYDDDGNLISQTAKYSSVQTVYVDLNGIKPPNTIGKDVFIFQVFFDKNIVRPFGYDKTQAEINSNCSLSGAGVYCAAKIINDGWKMKKDYPW